jgi:colanic acid/amylovoran biosynthesis glycosyltransferase
MRIIIFDGSLKPPTFVKFLAENIAGAGHTVFLAGKGRKVFTGRDGSGLYFLPVSVTGHLKGALAFVISLLNITFSAPVKLPFIVKQSVKQSSVSKKLSTFIFLSRIYAVKPELIHIQWSTHVELFKPLIEEGDIKFVVSFRGRMVNISPFVDEKVARLYREMFPKVDGFHAVSNSILENACLFGADAKKAMVIYPAVKDELFFNEQIKTCVYKKGEPLRILSVGRQHWKKGYPVAIDACKKLKERGVDFVYTIIAGGDKEELIYNIHDLGLEENVKLIDRLPHNEVLDAYRNAHLFLLPSFEEGVANVVLEAMALGTPVITTNCGGMEEVIENDKNGWIVPVRDEEAIVHAVENFISFPVSKIKDIVSAARETIKRNHIQSIQTDRMIGLYNKIRG